MNCPVCSQGMIEKDFGGVKVDVCQNGCKGIWFDWMELIKLDEKNEGLGKVLEEALNYPRTNDGSRGRIKCSKCGVLMHAHMYQSSTEVNVDECYACGGFFLDSGELTVIRNTFMSEQEEEEYTRKLLSEVPDYQEAQTDFTKQQQRTDAIRRYTRFMRLSYYMTGK